MDSILLAVLSGIFGLCCIGREIYVILRAKRIRICNLFLMMYGITYGIVLCLILLLERAGIYAVDGIYLRVDYSSQGILSLFWWFLGAVAGYIAFRVGFVLRLVRSVGHTPSASPWGQVRRQQRVRRGSALTRGRQLDHLQLTGVLCLLIGLVCFFIWAEGWGGYSNLFLNAAAIRNSSYGARNSLAFFAKPAQVVATVSMISLLLVRRKKNTWLNVVLFLLSFAASMLYYAAKDGRMVMAMYLLIVIFMWGGMFEVQASMGKKLGVLAIVFVVFIAVVLNMDRILQPLRGISVTADTQETLLDTILGELGYIYVAGQTSVNELLNQGSPLLIGHDLGLALFAWVPSALTPDGLIDVWNYNTNLIAGGNAMAQYPSDLISTAIYDLGFLGPVLLPFAWGMIIQRLERLFRDRSNPMMEIVYYSLSMTLIRVVNYSNLNYTVAAVFHLFVAAVVFWVVRRLKWK